jgi:hypothetical protein
VTGREGSAAVTDAGTPHPQPQPDRLYEVFQALDAAIQRHGEAINAFAADIAAARANIRAATEEQQ